MTAELDAITAAVDAGDLPTARQLLRDRIAARADEPDGHETEARLAESLGMSLVARRAWQLVLRHFPETTEAWSSLATLYDELGDAERATHCRRRSGELVVDAPEPVDPDLPPPDVADSDLVRFADLFAGRDGVHARMWHDRRRGTGYAPVHQPLDPALAGAHLQGGVTVGMYPIDVNQEVRWFVFDLDATPDALRRAAGDLARTRALQHQIAATGRSLLRHLRGLDLNPLLVDSGYKGRHLWCFLDRPTRADRVREFCSAALAAHGPVATSLVVEIFPRQDRVPPGGLGNLVKLPLGIHLRTGRRASVLDDDGEIDPEPHARLRSIRRTTLPAVPEASPGVPRVATEERPITAPEPPVVATIPWTEVRYETSPTVGPVLSRCAVLREVVRVGLRERRVGRDAAVVLNHSLGHLEDGVAACNHLYDRVPGFAAEGRMGAVHRGSPISCARIRSRLPEVARTVGCDCAFDSRPGAYPHPLRHLDDVPDPPAQASLEDLLGDWARHLARCRDLEEQTHALRRRVVEALAGAPGGRWAVDGGEWVLGDEAGLPVITWAAEASP